MVYLDSSALVKLLLPEPESQALRQYLVGREECLSSALARVEVFRALDRISASPTTRKRAGDLLQRLALLPLDEPVLRDAARLPTRFLRTLDALHLAAARSVDGPVSFVTYDRRLAAAAEEAGLTVESPA